MRIIFSLKGRRRRDRTVLQGSDLRHNMRMIVILKVAPEAPARIVDTNQMQGKSMFCTVDKLPAEWPAQPLFETQWMSLS
jgi:hypothetical protein